MTQQDNDSIAGAFENIAERPHQCASQEAHSRWEATIEDALFGALGWGDRTQELVRDALASRTGSHRSPANGK